MYKSIFLIINSLMFCSVIMAQGGQYKEMIIPLEIKNDSLLYSNIFLHLRKIDDNDMNDFKIPSYIEDYRISYVDMNTEQDVFKRFIENKLTNKDSLKYKDKFNDLIEYKKLYGRPLETTTYLLAAFFNGQKIIITDTDNDLDFTDEKVDKFEMPSLLGLKGKYRYDITTTPQRTINYEYYDFERKKIIPRNCKVRIVPYADNKSLIATSIYENFDIILKSDEGRIGNFSIEGKDYIILVKPYLSLDDFRYIKMKIFNSDDSLINISNKEIPFFREKDFVTIGSYEYKIVSSSIFGDALILSRVSNNRLASFILN